MTIAIILVHYHTPQILMKAIEALEADLDGREADIIVVDNGNTDEGITHLRQLPITHILTEHNLGYAGGLNLGVQHTAASILFFMNPDVIVLPGCISTLVDALNQDTDVAAPILYWDDHQLIRLPPTDQQSRIDQILRRLSYYHPRWQSIARRCWRAHAQAHWLATSPLTTYTLSGAMLGTRRDVWEKVGPFDEAYELYFEETDWLMRLKQLGLSAQLIPQAKAIHLYNQSAKHDPRSAQKMKQSERRFGERYFGRWFMMLLTWLLAPKTVEFQGDSLAPGRPEIDLSELGESDYPIWIEVSPTPMGFPAGGCRLHQPQSTWILPGEVWERLGAGQYFIRTVSARGHEHKLARFTHQNTSKQIPYDVQRSDLDRLN